MCLPQTLTPAALKTLEIVENCLHRSVREWSLVHHQVVDGEESLLGRPLNPHKSLLLLAGELLKVCCTEFGIWRHLLKKFGLEDTTTSLTA